MVAKIERKTSKMEETRLEMEEVMDDMILAVFGVRVIGWVEEKLGLKCDGNLWRWKLECDEKRVVFDCLGFSLLLCD